MSQGSSWHPKVFTTPKVASLAKIGSIQGGPELAGSRCKAPVEERPPSAVQPRGLSSRRRVGWKPGRIPSYRNGPSTVRRGVGRCHVRQVRLQMFSGAQARRQVAVGDGLQVAQQPLHRPLVQVRDTQDFVETCQEGGLDVLLRPPGRLPRNWDRPGGQKVLHLQSQRKASSMLGVTLHSAGTPLLTSL